MSKAINNKKGIVLFIVLGTLLIVVALAAVILDIINSQSRFTHHQASRIQAYYAAQAGMVYATERLRSMTWTFIPGAGGFNSCPGPTGCVQTENEFPGSIGSFDGSADRQFRIVFCPSGTTCNSTPCDPPDGIDFCIQSSTIYTYTAPPPS